MAVPTAATQDEDSQKKVAGKKSGGRCRTREAKRRFLLKAKVNNVTEEDKERQSKRVAQLVKELERAKELLAAMECALEKEEEEREEGSGASSVGDDRCYIDNDEMVGQKQMEEEPEVPPPPPPITLKSWLDDDDDDDLPSLDKMKDIMEDQDYPPDLEPEQPCQPLSKPLDQLIVGIIGHVAHGKSSIVKMLTGKSTMVFREERLLNATIKLGYADACIYRSLQTLRGRRRYFMLGGSQVVKDPTHPETGEKCEFVRKISFVDCPGHDRYTETMITGTAVMDAALVVVAANEDFPQPQMIEHLQAIKQASIIRSNQIVVIHNKIDLVGPHAVQHLPAIRALVGQDAAVVPCCAVQSGNKESIIEALVNLESPERDTSSTPLLRIIRSFDINKKGKSTNLGGVLGGAVIKGHLKLGDPITLYPGLRETDGSYSPIRATVKSLTAEGVPVHEARPGALVGVGTDIPANLSQADRLVGQIGGSLGDNLEVFENALQIVDIERRRDSKGIKAKRLKVGDHTLLMAGATKVVGSIVASGKHTLDIAVSKAVAVTPMQRVAISRKDPTMGWKIIAWGTIKTTLATPYLKYKHVSHEDELQAFYRAEVDDITSMDLSDFKRDLCKHKLPPGGFGPVGPPSVVSTVSEPPQPPPQQLVSVPSKEYFIVSDSECEGVEAKLRKVKKKKKKKVVSKESPDSDTEVYAGGVLGDAAYAGLLYQALDNITVKDSRTKIFKLPPPRVIKLTRHSIGIANFDSIVRHLNRSAEHIRSFIGTELSSSTSVDQNGCLIINKIFKASSVEVVLRKYAWLYVVCLMCHSGTDLEKADRGIFGLKCPNCLATRSVVAQQIALYTHTTKKSRREERERKQMAIGDGIVPDGRPSGKRRERLIKA
eukprot:TRINITY_DN8210_c0_g1_i1.p1 TRINITY_DN8210_c0_g1~~TRINITY_DN8210_c0_g1_i1.p1  ORF type:complete len:885 (+),score=143.38 TRINITY_DN8210_c0_g1_i1:39-2693(+)